MNFLLQAKRAYWSEHRPARKAYHATRKAFHATRKIYCALSERMRLVTLWGSKQVELTCATAEIVARQHGPAGYNRLDIFVAYRAIQEAAGKGGGLAQFDKLLRNDPERRIADRALLTVLQNGLTANFFVPAKPEVDAEMSLGHSVAAVAFAIAGGQRSIPILLTKHRPVARYDVEWFRRHDFSAQEIYELEATRQEVYQKLSILPLHRDEMSQVESELRQLLPKGTMLHGRGTFYQTCDDLLIGGQRPTDLRFSAYDMASVLKSSDRVLDIGCNCGFFALAVSKSVRAIDAFDVSPHFIAIANRAKEYLGNKNCEFTVCSFQEFTPIEPYDVILSFAVHHWIGIPMSAYAAKLQAMLKPGGLLLVESQDLSTHDHDWDKKLQSLISAGFEEIRSGTLCDDGLLARRHVLLRDCR
jgi:2-polyprenyl-3-methyl-5-hydroxy-6-metoxy-1,4-benzoquinol methylase